MTMLSSGSLNDVKHLKVSLSNPPTSSVEGLDFERCSALHNAIIRHQWQARGYDLANMPTMTWWQIPQHTDHLDGVEKVLPQSLVQFLKRALDTEYWPEWSSTFFHFVQGLASPKQMWQEVGQGIQDHDETERIALYTANAEMKFSDQTLDGIVFDCGNYACMYNSYDHCGFAQSENEAPLPWQYLETILTAWIDMIERGKAAIVTPAQAYEASCVGDDSGYYSLSQNLWSAWAWYNFTQADVDDAIAAWNDLVHLINERIPGTTQEPFSPGLFEASDLVAAGIKEGTFAWAFYRKACRPNFRFVAPGGLQVPSRDQLLNSPFEKGWESNTKHPSCPKPILPLPVLLGEELTDSWVDEYQYKSERPLCGLYLDKCYDRCDSSLYEDGARLILPCLSQDTLARMLDGKKAGPTDLYQIGQSPFTLDHQTPLWAILRNFCSHVVNGKWRISADGVDEPITNFEELCADPGPDSAEADEDRHDDLLCTYIRGWLNEADS